MKFGWFTRLAPLVVLQAFLWLTLGAFAFGPWSWPMRDPSGLYTFVIACHVAILFGYLGVAHRAPRATENAIDYKRLVVWSLVLTAIALPLTSYAKTGRWVPDVVGGIMDPGRAYAESHAYTEGATNFASYVRIVLAPWLAALVPLGVFYWSRLGRGLRIGLVASILVIALLSIATGQRRDIADLIIAVSLASLGAHWAGVTLWSRRAKAIGSIACAFAIVAFACYFVFSHVSRIGQQTADYGFNPVTHSAPDQDKPVLAFVPAEMRPGFLGLMHYFTTGYFGLSLALDRDVQPMYGLGHSMFLTRNWARATKDEGFESRSLPVQISEKDGFNYPVQWCTAYPYFANDLGFLGTVLLMFFLGRLFALAWIDALGGRSPASVVAFTLLATLLFYLPATNRMLQDGEGVVAFYSWLAVWGLIRLRAGSHARSRVVQRA